MNPLKRMLTKKSFKVTRFVDDNPRLFKSVPIRLPADWPQGLNYSARSRNSRITLEALPSDDKGSLCALLLLKPDDEFAAPDSDPAKLRAFFDEEFPQFGALIDDEEIAQVAKKPASALPAFRYAGPRLHFGKRTLVLGDAAHTVKPYYGLGANTALEDVEILSDILDEVAADSSSSGKQQQQQQQQQDPVVQAVPLFSKRRAADAEALVTISRNMDRPGKLFYVNFLIPLILDGIFSKIAPRIFSPNMFGMFQRQDIGFKQIQRKKRIDRSLQLTILATAAAGIAFSVKLMICSLAKALGKSSKVVTLGLVLVGAMVGAIQKAVASRKESSAGTSA
jgi:kynurenine 3-monooxygenase